MTPEQLETIAARAEPLSARVLATMLVEVYEAFLSGATSTQAAGVLGHRGVASVDALRIYDVVTKLTA